MAAPAGGAALIAQRNHEEHDRQERWSKVRKLLLAFFAEAPEAPVPARRGDRKVGLVENLLSWRTRIERVGDRAYLFDLRGRTSDLDPPHIRVLSLTPELEQQIAQFA